MTKFLIIVYFISILGCKFFKKSHKEVHKDAPPNTSEEQEELPIEQFLGLYLVSQDATTEDLNNLVLTYLESAKKLNEKLTKKLNLQTNNNLESNQNLITHDSMTFKLYDENLYNLNPKKQTTDIYLSQPNLFLSSEKHYNHLLGSGSSSSDISSIVSPFGSFDNEAFEFNRYNPYNLERRPTPVSILTSIGHIVTVLNDPSSTATLKISKGQKRSFDDTISELTKNITFEEFTEDEYGFTFFIKGAPLSALSSQLDKGTIIFSSVKTLDDTLKNKIMKDLSDRSSFLNILNNPDKNRLIAKGSFGQVFKVETDNHIYAVKKVDFSEDGSGKINSGIDHNIKKLTLNEIGILEHGLCNECLQYYGALRDEGYFYIVSEYADFGSLGDFIYNQKQSLSIDQIVSMMEQAQKILDLGIYNPDIKLDNFVIDQNKNPRMIDFGLAQKVHKQSTLLLARDGTPETMPPELFFTIPFDANYDDLNRVHSFSIGMTIIEALIPDIFNSKRIVIAQNNNTRISNVDLLIPSIKDEKMRPLLSKMIEPSIHKRISLSQAIEEIKVIFP